MNKFLLVLILFLASCTTPTNRNDLDISSEMSFDEFIVKLEEYAKNNPYPNIDN